MRAEQGDGQVLEPRRHAVDEGRADRDHGSLAGAEQGSGNAAGGKACESGEYAAECRADVETAAAVRFELA
ncbi:hypothetical protein GCM10009741_46830 [Kribbella lupini]|uniref:Uncharacterized protein n=1 Tax=Kribbella lupini TaxID=291602 RepID=A0ABN2BEC1_9ACTN